MTPCQIINVKNDQIKKNEKIPKLPKLPNDDDDHNEQNVDYVFSGLD